MPITTKRIYEPAVESDGFRVLVDRLWPRGLSKEKAQIDYWAREVAPSHELRKWFQHEPAKWDEFRERYRNELESAEAWRSFRAMIRKHPRTTLVFGSKELRLNNAAALKTFLEE